jgi:hypothetical protein
MGGTSMSYKDKKKLRIEENKRAFEAEEAERRRKEQIKYEPNKKPYKVTAYVRDVYRRVVDNGYVQQGVKSHETATFELEHPWACGGHGTYITHEYGGTKLLVELFVRGKEPLFVNVRSRVLELNQLVRIDDSKIEILKRNNVNRKFDITVRDTTSKYHGALVDDHEVIAQLNLICR